MHGPTWSEQNDPGLGCVVCQSQPGIMKRHLRSLSQKAEPNPWVIKKRVFLYPYVAELGAMDTPSTGTQNRVENVVISRNSTK